jgi:hypothetical protein
MTGSEQLIDDRAPVRTGPAGAPDEQLAREALRGQIARLEREISGVLAEAFPHLTTDIYGREREHGPRILNLAELELMRDRLAARAQDARDMLASRVQFEAQSRELLERMTLEPGRHKFTRVSVRDIGQGTCGVWEVRPRLGLIGMLAGWWQVKLSSGCPLPRGCVCLAQPSERTGQGSNRGSVPSKAPAAARR